MRPTKYKPEYCQVVIDYLSQGKSVTQLARHLKVNKSTIYQWAQDYPAFSDALKDAQEWSQAYWEDELESMMYNKDVNSPLVKLYFANRFKWHDRPATEGDDEKAQPLSITFEVREPVGQVKVTNAKPE